MQEELAKKDQEAATAKEEMKLVTLKKQPFLKPATSSFTSNPSTSKVVLIHPVGRDSKDSRDTRIISKNMRNDLKTSSQQHGAKGTQNSQPIPSIEIRQIPPFKKTSSQALHSNNLLPSVHIKNEKIKKSQDKKNLAGSSLKKS